MARTVRGCSTAQSQPEGTDKLETIPIGTQQKEQTDTIEGEVIADYEPELEYELEESDPENKPDAQEEEDKSNAE